MSKIEHPKVFISYAWIDEEFNKKVSEFVNRLRQDGIDTVFDQTDLKFGQSMPHFMESTVRDNEITNVLMLLTPEYKEKADNKTGGVGTETQIISSEVYQDVDNTKFIPVIFDKRGKNFKDCLPIYLKSRYFIDLSDIETYESNYNSLVRTLYGAPTSIKTQLGSKPEWVDNPDSINYDQNAIVFIKSYAIGNSDKYVILKSKEIYSRLIKKIKDINFQNDFDPNFFKSEYSKLTTIRNTFLNLISEIVVNDNIFEFLIYCFDQLSSYINELWLTNSSNYKVSLLTIFKHELIVSCIAILYKANRYNVINSLISTSYISYSENMGVTFDSYFYCYSDVYSFCEQLNVVLSSDKNRRLYCGLADFWVHNTCVPLVSFEDFVNADILISNLTLLNGDRWFPLSYVYCARNPKWLRNIAVSLTSKTLAQRLLGLFGVSNFDELENRLNTLYTNNSVSNSFRGYQNAIEEYPLLSEFLRKENILKKP